MDFQATTSDELLKEALEFGTRLARRIMPRDPEEAASVANFQVWAAWLTYKPQSSLKSWVSLRIRTECWDICRKKRKYRVPEEQWNELHISVSYDVPDNEYEIPSFDWKILVEHYLDRMPISHQARQYGCDIPCMKRLIDYAVDQLRKKL